MREKILALCDTEEEYARHMSEFLKNQKEMPWELYTYTDVDRLTEFIGQNSVELLVIAENAYTREVRSLPMPPTVLLNESGVIRWDGVRNVNKYQQAEQVFREILREYELMAGSIFPRLHMQEGTSFIGMYSPVRRCLQTSFGLTLGQMLAENHRTLYLNLEHYAGITGLLPDIQDRDLSDLLYFLTADKDKFLLRMKTILRKKGEMDYIPPMKAGQNLVTVSADEWNTLLKRIVDLGIYEYVILDLSESIQGLFDILRQCCKVFTLTREDGIAQSKLTQYEQVLALCEYEDVLNKTLKYSPPLFRRLPQEIEQYTRGELADYVRNLIKEIFV